MNRLKTRLFKAGLNAMYASGGHHLLRPVAKGKGIIFTMHHVMKHPYSGFAPNGILEITDEFLEAVITRIRWAGLNIVSIDEAAERLKDDKDDDRFAILTFDDGYRDNLEVAYPILKRHDAPFCVYVATDLPDGKADLWWLALEEIVRQNDHITCDLDGEAVDLPSETVAQKNCAYEKLYWWLRSCGQDRQRSFIQALALDANFDLAAQCRNLSMTWDEIKTLSLDPLATIGAHTMSHYALAQLEAERARTEMDQGANLISDVIGQRPEHLSYPYGDPGSAGQREFEMARRLGFKTAVTTSPGVLHDAHRGVMTALPRVSLNGEYQDLRYLDLFLSGAPFALFNKFRPVNAA